MATNSKNTKPYMNIGPGEFIREEMEYRNWTNEDLAQVMDLSQKTISELLNNKQRITIDTAYILGKVFGQSPQYWLNLDTNYRLRLKETNGESHESEIKSKIYERMPVNEMRKRGWIKDFNDIDELKNIFVEFWKLSEFDPIKIDSLHVPHTRKSDAWQKYNEYYLLAWTQMAKSASGQSTVPEYSKKRLEAIADEITGYSMKKQGVAGFLRALTGCGVKFICLSHLPRTYLDGASFIHDGNPVIVYTVRYDRVDNFWFTIAHEIGHVLKHIRNEKDIFIDDLKGEDKSRVEKEADQFAERVLKVPDILTYFKKYKNYISEKRVMECSEENMLHPSIITGILKHNKLLAYNRLNHLNESVSDKIPGKYIID